MSANTLKKLIFIFTLIFSQGLWALQDFVEINLEGLSSQKTVGAARKDIINQKILKISGEYIKEIIGEEKFNNRFSLINKNVIKKSGKYISYIKSGPVKKTAEGYTMTLKMKLSIKSLRTLLLQQGLLYDLKASPKILPMVSFINSVNLQQTNWWSGSKGSGFLKVLSKEFEEDLKRASFSKGFFTLSPLGFNLYHSIPDSLKGVESYRGNGIYEAIAKHFESVLVLRGSFNLLPSGKGAKGSYKINVNLEIVHINNGRVMASVSRKYNTNPGVFKRVIRVQLRKVFKDVSKALFDQLYGVWKKGILGTRLMKLSLKGNLNPVHLNQFKKLVLQNCTNIRSMKERLFTPDGITYEMDISTSSQKLANQFRKKNWPRFKVNVIGVYSDEVKLKVTPY